VEDVAKPEESARKSQPYQRGRHRGSAKKEDEVPSSKPQARTYKTKVYGLIQNPSLVEPEDAVAGPLNDFTNYFDFATNSAEVTWSQDPFRENGGVANGPVFDIDFSKDPSRSSSASSTSPEPTSSSPTISPSSSNPPLSSSFTSSDEQIPIKLFDPATIRIASNRPSSNVDDEQEVVSTRVVNVPRRIVTKAPVNTVYNEVTQEPSRVTSGARSFGASLSALRGQAPARQEQRQNTFDTPIQVFEQTGRTEPGQPTTFTEVEPVPLIEDSIRDIPNLFTSQEDASNAIENYYQGSTSTFFNDPPESRQSVPIIIPTTNEGLVANLGSSSEVSEVQIPIKLFDPFSFYANL